MEHFIVSSPIRSKTNPKEIWLEADSYPVLRHFDDDRVIIYSTPEGGAERELVIIAKNKGILTRAEKTSKTKTTSNS
jgi:hypothetical protein